MFLSQVTQEVRVATLAAAADIPGQEVDMPPPPGGCYVKLLHVIEDAAFSGKMSNFTPHYPISHF